jgi:hypothetical protein
MTNLETLKQQTADMEAKLNEMKAEIKRIENGWEMKYQYKLTDEYWFILSDGDIKPDKWINCEMDKERLIAGNVFQTKEAAELEQKRRNLLTRFRFFKDECNDGWKPDWKGFEMKWDINYKQGEGFRELCSNNVHSFSTFGYFKNKKDAERAIELFGDEIEELFVEV